MNPQFTSLVTCSFTLSPQLFQSCNFDSGWFSVVLGDRTCEEMLLPSQPQPVHLFCPSSEGRKTRNPWRFISLSWHHICGYLRTKSDRATGRSSGCPKISSDILRSLQVSRVGWAFQPSLGFSLLTPLYKKVNFIISKRQKGSGSFKQDCRRSVTIS